MSALILAAVGEVLSWECDQHSGCNEAGEIDPVNLVRNLRELVEAFGAVWIEGVVASVRETTARCLHFLLRVGERGSYQCRISSTTALLVTRPREGERVKLRVVPTIYEKRGDVQFDVFEVVPKEPG